MAWKSAWSNGDVSQATYVRLDTSKIYAFSKWHDTHSALHADSSASSSDIFGGAAGAAGVSALRAGDVAGSGAGGGPCSSCCCTRENAINALVS